MYPLLLIIERLHTMAFTIYRIENQIQQKPQNRPIPLMPLTITTSAYSLIRIAAK